MLIVPDDDAIMAAQWRLTVHLYYLPIQACSAKSLERLRSQQESLRSLKPQVVYLRDLARGLVQDSPQTPGDNTKGAQRLQRQAEDTEKEYDDVSDKVRGSAENRRRIVFKNSPDPSRFCVGTVWQTHKSNICICKEL